MATAQGSPLSEADVARLVDAARRVRANAWAPYSHFAVGAALLDEHGRLHVGCNVENAAYPQGLCAEAGAIAALVAAGGRRITAAAVAAVPHAGAGPVMPCGGCRQKLREFASADLPLVFADDERVLAHRTLGALLPDSFGPGLLGRDERGS